MPMYLWSRRPRTCSASSPISAFADDLHLEVVDAAGRRDGVGGPYRRRIFRGFAVTFGSGRNTDMGSSGMRAESPWTTTDIRNPQPEDCPDMATARLYGGGESGSSTTSRGHFCPQAWDQSREVDDRLKGNSACSGL
ncbi:hypothetical protein EYF80_050612 [Liparis tanakae]|uniref:Uncharacterized protein n=1 Tax=Liparis tanakae TaxID=230148 RepID=A0A4Z2FDJ0_9TELE|nr:hypothetical protein EYF80_050612 [Liparis tanakae]